MKNYGNWQGSIFTMNDLAEFIRTVVNDYDQEVDEKEKYKDCPKCKGIGRLLKSRK